MPEKKTAGTGEKCPVSGIWKSKDSKPTSAPIAKGNRMPPHNGKGVKWKLVKPA
jgi:hypothetical protein